MEYVCLDFETANANRTSICQIGAVKYRNGVVIDTYYVYVKPVPNYFDGINISVHGIKPHMVEEALTFDEVWETGFKDFINNQKVIAHNTSFDMYVLAKTLEYFDLEKPNITYECSLRLARHFIKDTYSFQLAHLVSNYCNCEINHHDALADAQGCGLLYQYLHENYDVANHVKKTYKKAGFINDKHHPFVKK